MVGMAAGKTAGVMDGAREKAEEKVMGAAQATMADISGGTTAAARSNR